MKLETRITGALQSISFSRRMLFVSGAQVAIGGVLLGRLGYLSVAQSEHYRLLSESNRVQLIVVPPRRGWIIDRQGKPIAINRSDFRVDVIPEQMTDRAATIATLIELLALTPDEVDRINREIKAAKGYQPVQIAESIPYERYAAVTVRLPELPGVQPQRGFSRFYPDGAAVGHLVGYVGTASAKEYEKEKNPLLITPGFKIGKEGLEKTLETRLRGTPGGQRVELTARGKLVRELTPKPDRSGGNRPAQHQRRPAGLCRAPAGRGIGLGHGARLPDRRLARPGLDAGLRPQQLLRRDRAERMADAVRATSAARSTTSH